MIRLIGNTIKSFTSATVSHPIKSGHTYTDYNINHNLGVIPDAMQIRVPGSEAAPYGAWFDMDYRDTDTRGYWWRDTTTTSALIRVYRLDGIARDIYFLFFAFGDTTHNAS